jgi:hypothetical protein
MGRFVVDAFDMVEMGGKEDLGDETRKELTKPFSVIRSR